MRVGNRRLGRIVETDLFPGLLLGDQCAQQFVVQFMPGLVTEKSADQAVAEQVQIADRVEDLVFDELVFVTQAVLVEHAVVVRTMALSIEPPSARFFSRSISMSRMNPNVRARDTSLTNEVVEKSIPALEVRRVKIG